MRVCDYIAKTLKEHGITRVYGLVGGSTSGLNDGFISDPDIEFIAFHHEQGAGHAAVGSARTNNRLAVCNVTAGCGVTNAMTSLLNAYEESAPVLFLSGNTSMSNQAKYINRERGIQLRKYGIQDFDCVRAVAGISKYAVAIERAEDVPYELARAIDLATSGRPGPVWIDVPGNLQTAQIPQDHRVYQVQTTATNAMDADVIAEICNMVRSSQRPVIVAGNGINLASQRKTFREFLDRTGIPFVTTFLSRDLVEYEHEQNLGMMGIKGNRVANFALQNSDCLLILGCSMNVTHIGYDTKTFSPHSRKIMIDIDSSELDKGIFAVDLAVCTDLKNFFDRSHAVTTADITSWKQKCLTWKHKWPIYREDVHRSDTGGLNLYEIVESINRNMQPDDCFIVDAGQPCYILSTNGKYRQGCRYMAQAAQGDMGYAIPASVGAAFADPSLNITIVIGEGSFYTNMQELAVIRQHQLPIKIFVINNDGYMSIKQTQNKMFGGRQWGVSNSTGVYFADIGRVAASFDIEYQSITNNQDLDDLMPTLLHCPRPVIVEFKSQDTLDVLPAQAIKPDGTQGTLHDMAPFLSAEELAQEMIVKI